MTTSNRLYQSGRNFIDGEWQQNRQDFVATNPATEEDIGWFPLSSDNQIDGAVAAAKNAQKAWREMSRVARGEHFDRLCAAIKNHSKWLSEIISVETGKNLNESVAEVNEALHMAQYTFGKSRMPVGDILPSEIAEKDCYVIRKAKGVVAVISPWNFPFAIGGFWCAAPAALEGCTVVFKPSEDSPFIGQMIARLYEEAGFPPGVFNLVHGDGSVGKALVEHKDVNHICFTGSYEVGKSIRLHCAEHGRKTCSCEMGSKSAVIVCADADIDMAVKACVASAYKLSGQRCVSAGRILVESRIYNEFANEFIRASKNVTIGDPFSTPAPDIGPLISKAQRDRVIDFNYKASQDENTQVLLAGSQVGEKGYFMSPHVYTTAWKKNESRPFLKNEVFGPHVAIIPFDDLDEAIAIYNDTDFGLALAVCTSDYMKMRKVREECEFGLAYVNLPCIGAESQIPFGGVKKSGYGGSSAAATFENVVDKVAWTVNHSNEIKMAQGLKV
jgi:aldehyde dehydrogenase (NAD+)